MSVPRRTAALLAAVAVVALPAVPAQAAASSSPASRCTTTWSAGTGDFDTARFWSDGVPDAADVACVVGTPGGRPPVVTVRRGTSVGSLVVARGTVVVAAGQTVTVTGVTSPGVDVERAGRLGAADTATLAAAQVFVAEGGDLLARHVTGTLTSAGAVVVRDLGGLDLRRTARTTITLGADPVSVLGAATLGGTLVLRVPPQGGPPAGSHTILVQATDPVTGTFAAVEPRPPDRTRIRLEYGVHDVEAVVDG